MCDHVTSGRLKIVENKILPFLQCDVCGQETKDYLTIHYICTPKLAVSLQPKVN